MWALKAHRSRFPHPSLQLHNPITNQRYIGSQTTHTRQQTGNQLFQQETIHGRTKALQLCGVKTNATTTLLPTIRMARVSLLKNWHNPNPLKKEEWPLIILNSLQNVQRNERKMKGGKKRTGGGKGKTTSKIGELLLLTQPKNTKIWPVHTRSSPVHQNHFDLKNHPRTHTQV